MHGRRQTALTVAAAGFFLLAGCTGLAAGTGSANHDAAASRPAAITAANQPVSTANQPATAANQPATAANQPATAANQPATAANQPGSPPAGTRAEALALAGRMLTLLVAPPGAQPVNPSPVPGPVDVSSAGGPAPYSVGTYRFFLVREPAATVHSFLLAHVPAGMRWAGAGLAPGTTNQVTVQWVGYSPRSLPAGIAAAELGIAAMPSAHGVLIRVDAGVTWSPPRTAAERLTAASFRSVTVAETTQLPKQRTVTRVFTSRAVIGRLVALVDAMAVSPVQDTQGMSCLAVVTVYRLTFTPGVVVLAGGCGGDQVIVNGKEQPRLEDLQGALPGAVRQLLSPGLKA